MDDCTITIPIKEYSVAGFRRIVSVMPLASIFKPWRTLRSASGKFRNNKRYINCDELTQYLEYDTHEPIISQEIFDAITAERKRRSNTETVDGKVARKSTHYSSKRIDEYSKLVGIAICKGSLTLF